jgi:hypothetical protein
MSDILRLKKRLFRRVRALWKNNDEKIFMLLQKTTLALIARVARLCRVVDTVIRELIHSFCG